MCILSVQNIATNKHASKEQEFLIGKMLKCSSYKALAEKYLVKLLKVLVDDLFSVNEEVKRKVVYKIVK